MSRWAKDYMRDDPKHDAVQVVAILKRPDRHGSLVAPLRTTLICAIPELRKLGEPLMEPYEEAKAADDCDFLVWDIHTQEKRDRLGISHFELRPASL